MIYHWYQADFTPVPGQQYNRARFRAQSMTEASFWIVKNPRFQARKLLKLEQVSPELDASLNKELLKHITEGKLICEK